MAREEGSGRAIMEGEEGERGQVQDEEAEDVDNGQPSDSRLNTQLQLTPQYQRETHAIDVSVTVLNSSFDGLSDLSRLRLPCPTRASQSVIILDCVKQSASVQGDARGRGRGLKVGESGGKEGGGRKGGLTLSQLVGFLHHY